ncbi:S41 family peptidase [Bombilactobacillus thymidiniphilus]|uniref:S41 family peptidase n=1 Tax=Bombilactobacillus thymidiniphilus TaxID=2923363 RepID=A0ABY4PDU6_9LACO|nr:S41 family peptidase [Bombilactobacillus thymidiniphilus]UQS83707.1 S41 family peptidase [Bombilactobacillus thymidiniphilus]
MKRKFSETTLILSIGGSFLVGMILTFIVLNSRFNFSTLGDISQVYQNINHNYYQKVSPKQLKNGAIKGMVNSLDDPYSQFLADEEQTSFNEDIASEISGIGVTIEKADQGIKIVSVVKNSPAQKAGLRVNDLITKIASHSTNKMSTEKATTLTRGKKGTKVKLQLKRQQLTFNKTLQRQPIKVPTVSGKLLTDDRMIGQITITQFSERTAKELQQQVKKLKNKGARKLIIDVRSNNGGLMDQAIEAASMFLPNGRNIMTLASRADGNITYKASSKYLNNYKVKLPTVVLVDKETASAAEIFAAALQQSGHLTVVGENTFGKGVAQTMTPLNDTSEMKITTAKWLTPNHDWINKKGLSPNVKVKYPSYMNIKPFTDTQILSLNSHNNDVKIAQQILQALGYDVPKSGVLDDQTVQQLKLWQMQNKVDPSGNLDVSTRQSLTQDLVKKAQADDPMQQKAVTILKEK